MSDAWIDELARRAATLGVTRRRVLGGSVGGLLAGVTGVPVPVAAACRLPKKGCTKGKQRCTGKCKKGKCAKCPAGQTLCAPGCIDGQTNGDHCGACDVACEAGLACAAGACGCPDGGAFVPALDRICWTRLVRDGFGAGQFDTPAGIAAGAAGEVYVVDSCNARLVRVAPL